MNPPQDEHGTGIKLIVVWVLVGVPLLWGVAQTLANAMKLFR